MAGNDWADSFSATRDAIRQADMERELQSVDSNPGLASVAQNASTTPVTAAMPPDSGLQAAAPPQAPPAIDPAVARQAIYRKYGRDAEADRMSQSAANVDLARAHIGQVKQLTANEGIAGKEAQLGLDIHTKANNDLLARQKITDATTAELRGYTNEDGSPREASEAERIANQTKLTARLYTAGHTDQAAANLKQMKDMITERIAADQATRKDAANKIAREVAAGNYDNVPGFIKDFSYDGVGHGVKGIKPLGNGKVQVTADGPSGKPVTKILPEESVRTMAMQQLAIAGSDNAAVADQAFHNIEVQIQSHKAATGASGAAAAHSAEGTKGLRLDNEKKQTLETARKAAADAMSVPEAARTPAQVNAIKAWAGISAAEHARAAGAAGTQQNRTMNAKVGMRDTTIKTMPDGDLYLGEASPTDKTPTWYPIKGAGPASAAPRPSAAIARPASKAEYDKLPPGTQYEAPNGQTLIKK
jgi:hypothetical protein